MSAQSPAQSNLLPYRLSSEDFGHYAAQCRKPMLVYFGAQDDAINLTEDVLVYGFNEDATATIQACNGTTQEFLKVPYSLGEGLCPIIKTVEDMLRIPSKHWRLSLRDEVLAPRDILEPAYISTGTPRPLELLLVPEVSLIHYLAQNDSIREWKHFSPGVADPITTDSRIYAQVAFHLIEPIPSPYWSRYSAQRQDSEWAFARMHQRLINEPATESFLRRIKDELQSVLSETALSLEEQDVITDGVLPQTMEVWYEGSASLHFADVTVFTRIYSPVLPKVVDVFLEHPISNCCRVLYRIHDPAPPIDQRLEIHHIRDIKGEPQLGRGWQFLFEVQLDASSNHRTAVSKDMERNHWGLSAADAEYIHDALFGSDTSILSSKITKYEAILFLLASVGLLVDPKMKRYRPAEREHPNWRLGRTKWGWLGARIRAACGVSIPGDEALLKSVAENSCFYWRNSYRDVFDDLDVEGGSPAL